MNVIRGHGLRSGVVKRLSFFEPYQYRFRPTKFFSAALVAGSASGSLRNMPKFKRPLLYYNDICRGFSSQSVLREEENDFDDDSQSPHGDLFNVHGKVGPFLVNKTASIRRTFGPSANSKALLTCGGPSLARYASFDPQYDRARNWIHFHPVGAAVVGPILIQGLVGALVEASFPQSVPVRSSMDHIAPLIVGVQCEASITVVDVNFSKETPSSGISTSTDGHEIKLETQCTTLRDGSLVAKGTFVVWIPDMMPDDTP